MRNTDLSEISYLVGQFVLGIAADVSVSIIATIKTAIASEPQLAMFAPAHGLDEIVCGSGIRVQWNKHKTAFLNGQHIDTSHTGEHDERAVPIPHHVVHRVVREPHSSGK